MTIIFDILKEEYKQKLYGERILLWFIVNEWIAFPKK